MKLKPQPRGRPRPTRATKGSRTRARPRGPQLWRRRGARRPGPSLARRIAARLPRAGRILAGLAAVGLTGGLAVLVSGPLLRVTDVAWAGERYTPAPELQSLLEEEQGRSVLAVDTVALGRRIEELPTVAKATVEASLTGGLRATVVEHTATLVWRTPRLQMLVAADRTLFAGLPADAALPADLAGLPAVKDVRFAAHLVQVGDVLPRGLLETARGLAQVDPAAFGSGAGDVRLRLEAQYGFVLVSEEAGWRIAFGFYGHDPDAAVVDIGARIEQQVSAVRTLFAAQAEAGIGWVDARNPGKVYFRAKG